MTRPSITAVNDLPSGAVVARETASRLVTVLLWVQGSYYLLTGMWPLVSIQSFQRVTGRKTDHLVTGDEADHWLVLTVGVLVTAISLPLLCAAMRRSWSVEVGLLAVGSAVGLIGIDVIYVSRQVIWPIYLVDAALQTLLVVGWAASTVLASSLVELRRPVAGSVRPGTTGESPGEGSHAPDATERPGVI